MSYAYVKTETVNCDFFTENEGFSGPQELQACRVCLATDIKLYHIHLHSLAATFGDVTGTPVSAFDGLPQHICATCGRLLQKYAAFRDRCRQAQAKLQAVQDTIPVITTDYVRSIDRTSTILLTTSSTLIIECALNTEELTTSINICSHDIKNESLTIEGPGHNIIKFEDNLDKIDDDIDSTDDSYVAPVTNKVNEDAISACSLRSSRKTDTNTSIVKKPVKRPRKLKSEKELINEHCNFLSKGVEKISDTKDLIKEKYTKKPRVKRKNSLHDDENGDVECQPKKKIPKRKEPEKKKSKKKVSTKTEPKPKREPRKKKMFNTHTEEELRDIADKYNMDLKILTKEQQVEQVQSRKQSKEYLNARFQCHVCFQGFLKEIGYKKHVACHDLSTGSHACDVCHSRFATRPQLLSHARRHRHQYICQRCGQISKDPTTAKMHFKWHEGFKFECKHCGKFYNKQSTYMNHVRETHTLVPCPACGDSVAGTRALAAHKENMHSENHQCPRCDAQFHNEAALRQHAACRGCERVSVPCPECGDAFASPTDLTTHLETQHSNQIYKCEQCNTFYKSDHQLGTHWARAHRGVQRPRYGGGAGHARDAPRSYMCEVCAKAYATETLLRYHQRLHTGERPFPCPMCPKRFRDKSVLQIHKNTHTGERPYKCALCPEAFKSYSQRYKHKLLVHTKERKHKCHLCDKTYIVSFDLKTHIRTVHMKLPVAPRAPRRRARAPAAGAALALPKTEDGVQLPLQKL